MDCIRYGKVNSISEIVFDRRSEYSFKEVLTPISQTLFFFTEDQCKEADPPKKGVIFFLRSCDLHALKRLDDMYLHNGPVDYYYKRIRDNIKIVLIGCKHSFESCFCVSMGTNISKNYDVSINVADGVYELNCKDATWNQFFMDLGASRHLVVPDQVHENKTIVKIPEHLTADVAGGGSYRKKNGERMRFKVLHKVLDYKQRNGYHMCVGCGRCDDICPEYISFSHCVNKLGDAIKEVTK